MRTKTGRRRRLLESLRAKCDRPSVGRDLAAPQASNTANLPPESSTDRYPSRPLRYGASLIANLELEFHVSPIRITKLRFSNRKYSPLFRPPWRIAISRSAVSSVVADRPLALGRPGAGGLVVSRFLIVTKCAFRILNGRKPQKRRRRDAGGTYGKKNDCAWGAKHCEHAGGYLGHRQDCLCY
jgi:hypothetical protein